jgi:hypothetical protein
MFLVIKLILIVWAVYALAYHIGEGNRMSFCPPILIFATVITALGIFILDYLGPALRDGVTVKPVYVEHTKTLYVEVDRFDVQAPLDIEHIEVIYKETKNTVTDGNK